jgi:integrase
LTGNKTIQRSWRKQKELFGRIRPLPFRHYQAAYTGPDLVLHKSTATFDTLLDARAWLNEERRRIDAGTWIPPERRNRRPTPATATADGVPGATPSHIRGGASWKRLKAINPATLPELEVIVENLPPRYQLLVLLATGCALRFGELVELRRSDTDLKEGKIMLRRTAVVANGRRTVGEPKSPAGVRDVAIPPHLLPAVRVHLATYVEWGRDGLLFPAPIRRGHLDYGSFYATWDAARNAAGRPDLRLHDLWDTGAVLGAQTGATLAQLMSRLGQSAPAMAIRYQHAAQDRNRAVAEALSRTVLATSRPDLGMPARPPIPGTS